MPKAIRIPTDIDIIDSPGESRVLFSAETNSPGTSVSQIVDAFVSAASAGMFSKDPTAATKAIVVESAERSVGHRQQHSWRVTGLQAGAYRVLLNMLHVAHQLTGPVEGIWLSSTTGSGPRLNTADVMNPLSIRAAKPPFVLLCRRDLRECREPLFRLEFKRPITDEELEVLCPLFLAWDNVAIRGGFVDQLQEEDVDLEIEAALAAQQTYLAAPNIVEHLFDEFVGGPPAFYAFLNMTMRLHSEFCALESLEIE